METDKCFGYSAECPLHMAFYYNEKLDPVEQDNRCFVWKECYRSWKESGGRIGLEGILKYGEEPRL